MKKFTATILVFFFFTTDILGSAPSAVIPIPSRLLKTIEKGSLIDISPEIGSIETEISGSDPLIIHIQDAHAVAEAQYQIKRILRELTAKHHIQLIGLEGAAGRLALGKFKFTPIDEVNSAVNNSMLRDGRLTGAELFAFENQDNALEFTGLEDKDLYKENLRIFQKTLGKWEAEKNALNPLEGELAVLKARIFSKPLQRFDEARSAFEERKQSLFSYVRYLNEAALKHLKLDLSDTRKQREFPNLIRVTILGRLESKIDKNRAAIDKERNALLEALARSAGEKTGDIENEFLLGTLRELGKGQWPTEIPPRYFFETLYAAAKKHEINLTPDGAFSEFAEFLILRSEMDAKKLFREISVLETRIYEYLIRTQEERELVSISRDWNLLEKFLGLEVSREEYESASAREKDILPSALSARMKRLAEQNKIQTSAHALQAKRGDSKDTVSDTLVEDARKFYDIARRRESAMVENLLGKVKERNLKAAVLITGGFHSEGIDEILAHKGVAHITISPRIREEVISDQYHRVILGGKTWLEQALNESAVSETGVSPVNSVFEQSIVAEKQEQDQKIVAALMSAEDYLNPRDPHQPERAALDAFVREGIPALLDWTGKQPGLSGNPSQWVQVANGYLGDFGSTALGQTRMRLEGEDSFGLSVVPAPASGMPPFSMTYALRAPFSAVGKPRAVAPESAMAASLGQNAATSGLILPANVRREFPDARHLAMNANLAAAHQYRFNGKTYSPPGLLVPRSTAVEEIGDEELVALVLDPRPGFITVIVEDDNAMTYATMYLIMRLMELAQREFTFGLATGGTTESLRKGLGLATLAKALFGQYLDWGKARGMNTLDDYLWRDPEVMKKLSAEGFWWPAPHTWDRDRFDEEAYFLKYQLGAYRNEQKYMLLRNAFPHWTEGQIDRAFVSPPVLYGSAIEAEARFIRNMSRFTSEEERSLFTLSGLGTGRHDGFAESALDAISLMGEIVTDLRKILDIPDTLTRVDYPRALLQADGLQRHSETTQIQNFGHFGGDMKFHKGFLRLMGKLRINFINDLINWLSMKRFEEIQDSLEENYRFSSEEEFLAELQKVLNYYSAERNPSGIGTPPWSMTQKTGGVIERAFNPDTVKIVMVGDQPHKQESAADSYIGQPNPLFTPSALYLARRTVLVATEMGARKMDKAGAWFFTSDNPNAALLTGERIEADWKQTAEGQRIAGPAGVKAAWSKKLAEASSLGSIPAQRTWKGLVNIFPDRPAMGDAAAADITALMKKLFTEQDRLVLNLASAPSQMDVWGSLVKLMSADPDYWREKFKKDPATGRAKIKMIHFDEFTGRDRTGTPIDENHEVSFRWLLRQNFFNPLTEALGIKFEDLEWYPIKGEADDIQAEAQRYEREVLTNPATGEPEIIDISIGGYGENGHWAFNDPPDADFNDPRLVKVVDVTKSAQNVAQQIQAYPKYFGKREDISPAITETMAVALKRVRYHFLLVPGPAKANAIYQAHTAKKPTTEVPASVFAFSKQQLEAAGISGARMEGVKVYIDEKAAIGTFRELMENLDISRQPDKDFVTELAKQVDLQSGQIANTPGFHPAVHEKLAALKQAVLETAPADILLARLKDLSDTQLSLDVAHLDEFMGDPWAVYEISKNSGLVQWVDDHLAINSIQASSLGKGIQRILLVDDDAIVRLTLSLLIKSWNQDLQVVEKPDGREGLDEYNRAKSEGRPFDLVITDVNMPRMNGDQLAREINPPGKEAVPVMMLTGLRAGNDPLIAPLLESGQIRLVLEKPFDNSDIFAFLETVNRELRAKPEGSSLGQNAEVVQLLEAEGRNLPAVTGTIEQFSGGMVGNERNPAVLDYLLSIYADPAADQSTAQSEVTEGEFAVLLTTPKYLSPESVKAQLKVNPRALVVVVAEGSADKVKQYTQAMRREFPAGFGQNFLVIPADRGQTGQVFKDLLFGKNRELWERASSLYPELVLNYTNLAQYTSVFASANDLQLVSASLATKLAAPRKAELNRGQVASGEFNLYANTLAFLIARKGGFAKLSKEIPDVNQGIVPMSGINEFGFNISALKETIAGLVAKFQEMLALSRAA